jgi:hypothetical protein
MAPRKTSQRQQAPVTWREVSQVLQDERTRSLVTGQIKLAGFTLDHLASLKTARICLAAALTAAEDLYETEHPKRTTDRGAIAALRRRLELELWP